MFQIIFLLPVILGRAGGIRGISGGEARGGGKGVNLKSKTEMESPIL